MVLCVRNQCAFGNVDRARDKLTNAIVALKKIRIDSENDGLPLAHYREILLLQSLHHRNIVEMKEVVVGRNINSIFTVMEYCEVDMAVLLDSMASPFLKSEIKTMMRELMEGSTVAHQHPRSVVWDPAEY